MALADGASRRLAAEREGLRQQVVERFTVARAFAELVRMLADLGNVQQLHLRLEPVDGGDPALVLLELAPLPEPESAIYKTLRHCL